jgi:pilus assembly protein Flp/PilA
MMPNAIPGCGVGNGDESPGNLPDCAREDAVPVRYPPKSNPWATSTRQYEKEFTMNFIKNFLREEDGVTAIEYGLIAAVVGIVILSSATEVGKALKATFNKISVAMGGANGA